MAIFVKPQAVDAYEKKGLGRIGGAPRRLTSLAEQATPSS